MDTLPCSISNYLSGTLQKHTGLSVDIFFSLVLQFGPSQVNLEHIPHCTTDLIGDGRELIVPAGVFGREAPSMESFFPRPGGWMFDGEGVGVTNSTAREGADKCGVGGCLRWNPES